MTDMKKGRIEFDDPTFRASDENPAIAAARKAPGTVVRREQQIQCTACHTTDGFLVTDDGQYCAHCAMQEPATWVAINGTENLPDKDGPYLVTIRYTHNGASRIEMRNFNVKDGEFSGAFYSHIRLMAWMPLPEPYQEEPK